MKQQLGLDSAAASMMHTDSASTLCTLVCRQVLTYGIATAAVLRLVLIVAGVDIGEAERGGAGSWWLSGGAKLGSALSALLAHANQSS